MKINDEEEFVDELGELYDVCWIGFIEDGDIRYSYGIPECSMEDKIPDFIKVRRYEGDYITGVCRLSLWKPEYITGYNENMVLPENIKTDIMRSLNEMKPTPVYVVAEPGVVVNCTRWEDIFNKLDNFLKIMKKPTHFFKEKDNYAIPNYLEI